MDITVDNDMFVPHRYLRNIQNNRLIFAENKIFLTREEKRKKKKEKN